MADLAPGVVFQLTDLVPPDRWTSAPKGARLSAGMAFRREMERDPLVECRGRDAENHQCYRKVAAAVPTWS